MSGNGELIDDGRTLAVRVPITVARRGGRKVILAPDDAAIPRDRGNVDSALVRALARAFRWRKLIETGVYGTIAELALAEKVNPSYVSRLLRLTLLAPEVVEAILDGRQSADLQLDWLLKPSTINWFEHRPPRPALRALPILRLRHLSAPSAAPRVRTRWHRR